MITSEVKTETYHAGVERCDEEVEIGQHDCHGAVDDTVAAVHETFGLVRVAGVGARYGQRRVGQIQLLTPANERGRSGGRGGDVRVVGSDWQTGCGLALVDGMGGMRWGGRLTAIPVEQNFLSSESMQTVSI